MPHNDCAERADLLQRVLDSPRGSCLALPTRVLNRMLTNLGYSQQELSHVLLSKDELARFVSAARALALHPQQQSASSSPPDAASTKGRTESTTSYQQQQWPHAARHVSELSPYATHVRQPASGEGVRGPPRGSSCCVVM